MDTPLEECERRDPKGRYGRARAGELHALSGVDDTYEAPLAVAVTLVPPDAPEAIEQLVDELRARRRPASCDPVRASGWLGAPVA